MSVESMLMRVCGWAGDFLLEFFCQAGGIGPTPSGMFPHVCRNFQAVGGAGRLPGVRSGFPSGVVRRRVVGWRVVFLFVAMWLPTISAGEITGRLGFFRDEEGAKYFGVAVDRTLVLKSSEGGMLRSDFPQLAGLDQKKYEQAVNWNGRRVRVTGEPMERHTVHHSTPVLWLAQEVGLADEAKPSAAATQRIEEVPRGSALRAQLFDLARPEAEEIAGQPVKFAGRMVRLGDWVYFSGNVVDSKGRKIMVRDLASDTVVLWKREAGRWKLLNAGVGASDAYHLDYWPEKFGAPLRLLRGE
jgi:hypothetical protein